MDRIDELEWYVRDHISRYYNLPNTIVRKEALVDGLIKHIRYKGSSREEISVLMEEVLRRLYTKGIIDKEKSIMLHMLERYKCKDCMYVSYISDVEEMICIRCNSHNIERFIVKK
ncbi:MAG: hypothetical protein QW416_00330 [Candidatus Nitrosocaldaceae archaeon]